MHSCIYNNDSEDNKKIRIAQHFLNYSDSNPVTIKAFYCLRPITLSYFHKLLANCYLTIIIKIVAYADDTTFVYDMNIKICEQNVVLISIFSLYNFE